MERAATTMLRIGEWRVDPRSGQILRGGQSARLDVRAMRLLTCLAERAGEVVSIDDLLSQVWQGVIVSPDSVYQAVASLRRQLGDDPKQPAYIETVPRLGYRMVATVTSLPGEQIGTQGSEDYAAEQAGTAATARIAEQPPNDMQTVSRDSRARIASLRTRFLWGGAIVCAALFAVLIYGRLAGNRHSVAGADASFPQKSLAVLPFLDLTEGMKEEEFADGLTITPRPLHGAEIETYNDHRMAMSMALIGLRVPGIVIKNPGCVAKTYPQFFSDLEQLRQEPREDQS